MVCTYFILITPIQQQKHSSCVVICLFPYFLLGTVFLFVKHFGQVKKYFGEEKNSLAENFPVIYLPNLCFL